MRKTRIFTYYVLVRTFGKTNNGQSNVVASLFGPPCRSSVKIRVIDQSSRSQDEQYSLFSAKGARYRGRNIIDSPYDVHAFWLLKLSVRFLLSFFSSFLVSSLNVGLH